MHVDKAVATAYEARGISPTLEPLPLASIVFMQTRIYLVEDNPFILEWLTQALEELTHARVIGSAATEAEASHWLRVHQDAWDIAVVDLWLAQGNGLQVIKCVKKAETQKIIILTNYVTKEMRKSCLNSGADAFFDKSTEIEEFTSYVIHAALQNARCLNRMRTGQTPPSDAGAPTDPAQDRPLATTQQSAK